MTSFRQYTPQNAPEGSRPILEQVRGRFGFVPNLMATLAESPQALEGYVTLDRLVSESSLTPQEQQVALLTVSAENGCEYCVAAHTVVGVMQQVPADVIAAIREGRDIPDAHYAALARFTRAVVRARGRVTDAELAAFLGSGFTKRNVLEVILAVTQKTLSNYVNHVAATPLDEEFKAAAWTAPRAARSGVAA